MVNCHPDVLETIQAACPSAVWFEAAYEPVTCIGLDPLNGVPLRVLPINVAWLSPSCNPVLWVLNCKTMSSNPSPFTSCKDEWTDTASVPALPNLTVSGFTLVASNVGVERMATGTTP